MSNLAACHDFTEQSPHFFSKNSAKRLFSPSTHATAELSINSMTATRICLPTIFVLWLAIGESSVSQAQAPIRIGSESSPAAETSPDVSPKSVGQLIRRRFTNILLAGGQSSSDDSDQSGLFDREMTDRKAALETDPEETESGSANDNPPQEKNQSEQQGQQQTSMLNRVADLRKPVTEITIQTNVDGIAPTDRARQLTDREPMISIAAFGAGPILPQRCTAGFVHRPLYFEQRNLERCGNGFGFWQNAISGSQFLFRTALLPYQLGQQPCSCCVQAGGDCTCCQSYPCDCSHWRCNPRSLTMQAAAIAGFTLLVL